jgi:hypothetical protein
MLRSNCANITVNGPPLLHIEWSSALPSTYEAMVLCPRFTSCAEVDIC